jgi:hypothetical protein
VDSPVYTYRGVMVDTARQPHNFLFHMAMLDQLATNKLNIYQLHASDGGPPPSLPASTSVHPPFLFHFPTNLVTALPNNRCN